MYRLPRGIPDAHHVYPWHGAWGGVRWAGPAAQRRGAAPHPLTPTSEVEQMEREEWAAGVWLGLGSAAKAARCGPLIALDPPLVSDLSEPVDVYSDWIDACEAANQ